MMSRISIRGLALASALALVAAAAPLVAQATADKPLKIALIDVERLVKESASGKEALAKLRALQEQKIGEAKAKQEEIEGLRKRLSEGRLSLADDKIAALEKELEDRAIAFRRFQDDADRELQKKRDESFADIERRVMPIIQQLGKEFGYTLVFNKFQAGLVYADEGSDITPLVIQRFDAAKGK